MKDIFLFTFSPYTFIFVLLDNLEEQKKKIKQKDKCALFCTSFCYSTSNQIDWKITTIYVMFLNSSSHSTSVN